MGNIIDLRKYNIKSEQDAIEFLELFVSKAPQLISYLKDQRLKNASLVNQVRFMKESQPAATPQVDEEASVLQRVTGAPVPEKPRAQSRLEQLRAVVGRDKQEPKKKEEESLDLPPAPEPGDIGQLNVPVVDPKVPEATTAPELPSTDEEEPAELTEEEKAALVGPVKEDTTSIGETIAKKTDNGKTLIKKILNK